MRVEPEWARSLRQLLNQFMLSVPDVITAHRQELFRSGDAYDEALRNFQKIRNNLAHLSEFRTRRAVVSASMFLVAADELLSDRSAFTESMLIDALEKALPHARDLLFQLHLDDSETNAGEAVAPISVRILQVTCRMLPASARARYSAEFTSELLGQNSRRAQVAYAVSLLRAVPSMRNALRADTRMTRSTSS